MALAFGAPDEQSPGDFFKTQEFSAQWPSHQSWSQPRRNWRPYRERRRHNDRHGPGFDGSWLPSWWSLSRVGPFSGHVQARATRKGKEGARASHKPRSRKPRPRRSPSRLGGVRSGSPISPGRFEPLSCATLYAKVSGYLKDLKVDRGDRVKRDQVLAQIYVPELDVAVLQAESSLQHSRALATQAEAG